MIQQSVLLELEKQKAKLAMDQQDKKTSSSKVKSPVKRKSQLTNCSSRENDKKRKKFMRDNFEDEKEQLKKDDKKRKTEMRDNLEEEKKEYSKKEDNKRKKAKRDNFNDFEKEQLRKYEKEGKKVLRHNLDDKKKEHLKKEDNKRKKKSVITSMLMKKNK